MAVYSSDNVRLGPWLDDDGKFVGDGYYHSEKEHLSFSGVKTFAHSPKEFEQIYLNGERREGKSSDMDLGTVAHHLVLTPDDEPCWVVQPDSIKQRRLSGANAKTPTAWEKFRDANAGKVIVTAAQEAAAAKIREAVYADPRARDLLSLCELREAAYGFLHQAGESQIASKFKMDGGSVKHNLLVDLKTTNDPEKFEYHLELHKDDKRGYANQFAYYSEGFFAMFGDYPSVAVIVAQSRSPFETRVVEISRARIRRAYEENLEVLSYFDECRQDGVFLSQLAKRREYECI